MIQVQDADDRTHSSLTYSLSNVKKKDTSFNVGPHNVSRDIKVDADELSL